MNVLYKFVEEARVRYKEASKPNVTVHMADMVSDTLFLRYSLPN